jgi:hypothetical protein
MPRRNKPVEQHRSTLTNNLNNCQSKRRFRSLNEAEKVAELQMLQDMRLELSVYKCDYCGGWHLTSHHNNE